MVRGRRQTIADGLAAWLRSSVSIIISEMRSLTLALFLTVGLGAPAVAGQVRAPQAAPPAEKDPTYLFLLGRHLEGEGKMDEAIAAHKQAIALAPKSAELRAELAGLYARTDKAQEAMTTAQEAVALDPNNQEANKILGTIYAALAEQRQAIAPGDNPADYPARAIAALEKARKDDAFDINLDLMLGRLYAQTGAFEKALPLLRHVVDDQPQYQEGALLLAAAQESAGKPDDALETLRQTLRMNPEFYRGQLRLAETAERAGKWDDAAAALEKALTLNPRNTALLPRRAIALLNGGKAGDARHPPEAR